MSMKNNPYSEYTESMATLEQVTEQEQAAAAQRTSPFSFGKIENPTLPVYLWYPYFPKKEISCIFGKQDVGKGFFAAAIGAAISNGRRPLTDDIKPKEVVLFLSAEERDTDIERKFRYCGADMAKIGKAGREKSCGADGKPLYNIAERPEELEADIKQSGAGLVFIDPIQDFLGVKNLNAAEEVGAALVKLNRIADHCNCHITFFAHPSKAKDITDTLDSVAGSAEFTRKPRSVLQIIRDETGQDPNRRVMVHIKHNGTIEGNAIAYNIETVDDAEIVEEMTEETAPPAKAYFTGYSTVTKSVLDSAAACKKSVVQYLEANPTSTPNTLLLAANTLQNIAEKAGTQTVYVSRKGLKDHFPDYFTGTMPNTVTALKPKMMERGYYIEYTTPMGKSRKDWYGIENDRAIKITKMNS